MTKPQIQRTKSGTFKNTSKTKKGKTISTKQAISQLSEYYKPRLSQAAERKLLRNTLGTLRTHYKGHVGTKRSSVKYENVNGDVLSILAEKLPPKNRARMAELNKRTKSIVRETQLHTKDDKVLRVFKKLKEFEKKLFEVVKYHPDYKIWVPVAHTIPWLKQKRLPNTPIITPALFAQLLNNDRSDATWYRKWLGHENIFKRYIFYTIAKSMMGNFNQYETHPELYHGYYGQLEQGNLIITRNKLSLITFFDFMSMTYKRHLPHHYGNAYPIHLGPYKGVRITQKRDVDPDMAFTNVELFPDFE